MGYTIPQSVNDEAMEYVNNLAYSINMEWCEGPCLSRWNGCFLSRMQRGVIKLPFKYEAFLDNKDIIATLEGYGLDVEKFWFVLLFIYDLTMEFGINVADASKSDYDILVEIDDYLQNHPQAVLYLSDDKELRKSYRYETNSPLILQYLRRFVKQELDRYKDPLASREVRSLDLFNKCNYTKSISSSHQQVLMYKLFKVLFDKLALPDLKAKQGDTVSYSKMLLISRIIYFCRLTKNESFTIDSSPLKGILKQYGDFDFYNLNSKSYDGELMFPQNEGE